MICAGSARIVFRFVHRYISTGRCLVAVLPHPLPDSMKIRISYVGYMRLDGIEKNSSIDVVENATIADLLTRYNVTTEHQKFIIPFVNDKKVTLSHILEDGDSLFLLLPVGGG